MHSLETKNQFIELRAEGLSLDAISSQLDVPRSTLGRWHHESIEQIQRLRSLQWHLLEEQIGHRLEDSLQRVAHRIRRWEDELDTRDPHCRTTIELVRIIRDSRREYLQLRALLLAPLQPTRGRAACLTSLDPQKRDKTRQNSNALDPTPLPANDLQQPNPAPSHSPVTPEVTRGLTSSEPSSNNLNPNLNPNPDPSLESPAIDSSSASSCLCCKPTNQVAESHGVITEPPINTPLQRGEPAEPLAPPTASAVSPSAPPSAAESSQLITPNDASPALPLPGGEGRGEGQTSPPASPASPAPSSESAAPAHNLNPDPSSGSQRLCVESSHPYTPKKHKPYWLNGHYYENPEYPENVARAMFARPASGPDRASLNGRTYPGVY